MADHRESNEIKWYAPDPRAVLPLESFHVPKTLAKLIRREPFRVVTDHDFTGVIKACAERETTWISDQIIQAYSKLHESGYAHSIECWKDSQLVGGLYGVAIGGAFFGESMFHRIRDASKVALVYLVELLRSKGYVLLDTQFSTPHLERFGVIEIPREQYEYQLKKAISVDVQSWSLP